MGARVILTGRVSIPFERESIFRLKHMPKLMNLLTSFHSLRAGKYIQTKPEFPYNGEEIMVSIPFERESIFRHKEMERTDIRGNKVSIPFERESIFRQDNQ